MINEQGRPFEKIVIARLNHDATATRTMVFQIPPTVAEHNVAFELLKRIRTDYPGAWLCAQQWERDEMRPKAIGETVPKIKEVTREHLGLPADDPIGDIPL